MSTVMLNPIQLKPGAGEGETGTGNKSSEGILGTALRQRELDKNCRSVYSCIACNLVFIGNYL